MHVQTRRATRQLAPPFLPSNAACNIEIALCTLRCRVDGLPPNLNAPLRSEFAGGGGGVGGELILDALGEDARSSDGVSRPSSDGVIGRDGVSMGINGGKVVELGASDWRWFLLWPSNADFSAAGGGNRSFSISDRRASSKVEMACLMPSAPSASVP